MRSEQEALRWDGWRWTIPLFAIAGLAGRHDIIRRVATAMRQRRDVILRQPLRLDVAIGAAVVVRFLDRTPLIAREGGWEVLLSRFTALLLNPLGFTNRLRILNPFQAHCGVDFVPVSISPSSFLDSGCFRVSRTRSPHRLPSLGADGFNSYSSNSLLIFLMANFPCTFRLRAGSNFFTMFTIVILQIASRTQTACLMLGRLSTLRANAQRRWSLMCRFTISRAPPLPFLWRQSVPVTLLDQESALRVLFGPCLCLSKCSDSICAVVGRKIATNTHILAPLGRGFVTTGAFT